MGDRYLVTGGAGFIGATLVRTLLDRGAQVTVLDSGAAAGFGYLEGLPIKIVHADVADQEALGVALTGCSGVVHLAAQTNVPESIRTPEVDFEHNVTGSLGVLEACRRVGVERFVFASSNAVVSGHGPPAHEKLPAKPVSPYGAAKAAVEGYVASFSAAYGMAGVSLRFANAYGPFSSHKASVVASFVRAYLAGGPLVIRGDGRQTRDFVHVADMAAAIVACLDAPASTIAGEVFQVGTGTETSLLELAELLFDAGGGRVAVAREAPSPGDVARNVSDISKARAVLGYAPRWTLGAGLANTLEWFRDR